MRFIFFFGWGGTLNHDFCCSGDNNDGGDVKAAVMAIGWKENKFSVPQLGTYIQYIHKSNRMPETPTGTRSKRRTKKKNQPIS